MDAHDLFKKLSAGVNFNVKRFHQDAERFRLARKKSDDTIQAEKDQELSNNSAPSPPVKRKHSEDEDDSEETQKKTDTLTLINGIVIPKDGSKVKRKKVKQAVTEEKLQKQEQEKINHLRNMHRIAVTGSQVPKPICEFDELISRYDVSENLMNNVKSSGYHHPTAIQMQAIPAMLEGRQILACAPTGSGKTVAFLLPIIHHLVGPQRSGFRAIILSPTRELAKQTYRECVRLSEGTDFRIHTLSKINQALHKYGPKSSQKFDILITTPKRLIFLLNQEPPAISLSNVEWLVIDEADKLFEDGVRSFKDQLNEISAACTCSDLRRVMFSATNTPAVTKWCRRNLQGLITITVGHRNAATDLVEQELLFVGTERGKLIAFRNIVQKGMAPPVLVFVQSKERAQELFNELIYDGINVDVIHADRTQTQRDNVVRCFREGKIWVLICTELMSRGIDFKDVNLVINYDFPPSAISYIHRIGRTGRAGHKGKAITFFTEQDTTNLRSIAAIMRDSGCEVPEYMLAMKKHSKKERRKLERTAPLRDGILTIPKKRREDMAKRKALQQNKQNKENRSSVNSKAEKSKKGKEIAAKRNAKKQTKKHKKKTENVT